MDNKKLIPMFKWSGGKRRELSHVHEYMPDKFDKFCEPFVGGGAVWFNLKHTENVVGDVNEDVINFSFPEDGILIPAGVYCKTKTKVAASPLVFNSAFASTPPILLEPFGTIVKALVPKVLV